MVVIYFYDGPTPSRVFDDFLAIPPTQGNFSTTTYYDFVQSLGPLVATNGRRLVAQSVVWWNMG
jgi:hypothetical protein